MERRKEGAGPLALNQFGLGLGGGAPHSPLLPSTSTKAHEGPLTPPGCSGNPPVLRYFSGNARNHSGVRI